MKKIFLTCILMIISRTGFSYEMWCTKSNSSASQVFKNHKLWFENLHRSSHIPYIKFNKNLSFKSRKEDGQWFFDPLVANYKRGKCNIEASFYVSGSVYKDQFIAANTILKYGEKIRSVRTGCLYYGCEYESYLAINSELGLLNFTINSYNTLECSAGDLSLAAKKLGITLYFFHPDDARDCRFESEELLPLEKETDEFGPQAI